MYCYVSDWIVGGQGVKVQRCMLDMKETAQQVVVVLAECKSMSFHRWIPSAEEQGPGLDCGWGPEELSDSQQREEIQMLVMSLGFVVSLVS